MSLKMIGPSLAQGEGREPFVRVAILSHISNIPVHIK